MKYRISRLPLVLLVFVSILSRDISSNRNGEEFVPYPIESRRFRSEAHAGNSKVPLCDEDQLMIFLAELDAINPESIINLITVEDMESLCTKVSTSLDRMNCYLKHCEPPEQKDLYIQLIKGVNELYSKICTPSLFKNEFEKYFECIQDLHEDFKACTGPPDWTELCNHQKVCKAYKSILDCYYVKTATLCGLNAAHLFKTLAMHVINRILTQKCSNVIADPKVKNPMPEEYVSRSNYIMAPSVILAAIPGTVFIIKCILF